MMQTTKAKQALKLAAMTKELPQSDNMITVKSMLNAKDSEFITNNSIGRICVQVGEEMFFLSPIHKIPSTAKLVRQDEGQHLGQIVGLPAVAGG